MTSTPAPAPRTPKTPNPVSSTPILRTVLIWSAGVAVVLAVAGAVIGFLVAGAPGLWSGLVGVLLAAVFLAITGASILIANRWYGDPLYVPIFFGVVTGGWILKLVAFIVVLLVLRGQPWLVPTVFFAAVVASVIASLVIDVVVLLRMRIPHVSDVELPTSDPDAADDVPARRDASTGDAADSAGRGA